MSSRRGLQDHCIDKIPVAFLNLPGELSIGAVRVLILARMRRASASCPRRGFFGLRPVATKFRPPYRPGAGEDTRTVVMNEAGGFDDVNLLKALGAEALGAPAFDEDGPNEGNDVREPKLVVFSGGTAFNSVAADVKKLTTKVSYVLPVSDDGGSTAEIVRVLGGPAVGDIRSRCLRLADESNEEARAVKRLLAYRLSSASAQEAKREWYEIVEGDHELWEGVSEPYKHTIRAFLVHFHAQILRHSSERFGFTGGSVGNFFFAGARTFLRSLEAAIFMFTRVARIPEGSMVLPAICTEERIKLAAELENGRVMVGQHAISHPSCDIGSVAVDKSHWEELEHPIRRIFYLSSEGDTKEHEVAPVANPRVISELSSADAIVYGMGSLYTSICPCLILKGTGESIASRACPKVLILNGVMDREMSASLSHPGQMKASDVVLSITDALNRRGASSKVGELRHLPSRYVTEILVPRGGPIEIDVEVLAELGIKRVVEVDSAPADTGVHFEPDALMSELARAHVIARANSERPSPPPRPYT